MKVLEVALLGAFSVIVKTDGSFAVQCPGPCKLFLEAATSSAQLRVRDLGCRLLLLRNFGRGKKRRWPGARSQEPAASGDRVGQCSMFVPSEL